MDSSAYVFALFLSSFAFLLSLFSFFFFKFYLKRRTSKERFFSEMQDEANGIVKRINEITDRDISLIKERENDLRTLLKETEKRITVYNKELEKTKEADIVYEQLRSQGMSYQEIGENRFRLNFEVLAESKDESAKEPVPESSVAGEAALKIVTEDKPSMREQIISLVNAGFTAPIIASRLKVSIAQVELAVALAVAFQEKEEPLEIRSAVHEK